MKKDSRADVASSCIIWREGIGDEASFRTCASSSAYRLVT